MNDIDISKLTPEQFTALAAQVNAYAKANPSFIYDDIFKMMSDRNISMSRLSKEYQRRNKAKSS